MQDVAVVSKTGELFSAEVINTVKPRTYTAIELMYFGAVKCTSKSSKIKAAMHVPLIQEAPNMGELQDSQNRAF